MKLSDFTYYLPEELIAQTPIKERDKSRLLTIDKVTGEIEHKTFSDIIDYLNEGDCLVVNDSRVIPARLHAVRIDTEAENPAPVEIFLIRPHGGNRWECIVKPGKKVKKGRKFRIDDLRFTVTDELETGNRVIEFEYEGDVYDRLKQLGEVPLPPYIKEKLDDPERYQTVYSKAEGSVAAPTAGLHFTPELLEKIKAKGVKVVSVTLHVGIGTFRPVKVDVIEEHKMHSEYYILPQATAEVINQTKKDGGKVIAVGTTACRVLETAGRDAKGCPLSECCGETDIFIYPGFKFTVIDNLITNFHLPESTLLMLVSALAGRENMLNAYNEAVKERYRFFSFGDACFIH